MRAQKKLLLNEFVQAEVEQSDWLRITHGELGRTVTSGDTVLMRPDGSTAFDTPQHAFRVLAGAGIRCAVIEWDGLDALTE